jgi:hypothetical protein
LLLSFVLIILLISNLELFVRASVILIIFSYLVFTYINNKFYLYRFFFLSFILAIIQFIFLFISPEFSYFLGPKNLSKLFLGQYAGPTNTNFYEIFLIPRVSGLSREGGFFASLVVAVILIYKLDYKYKKFFFKYPLFISFLISLSKASLGIISIMFLKFKKIIFKVPFKVTLFFIVYIIIMIFIISPFIIEWALSNNGGTFLHRFGGYYLMQFGSISEFLFGHFNMSNYYNLDFVQDIWGFVKDGNWTGWSFLLVKIGLLPTILIIFLLEILGFTLLDLILLTVLSFNTNPLAITNNVVLIYFIIFLLHSKRIYYANN